MRNKHFAPHPLALGMAMALYVGAVDASDFVTKQQLQESGIRLSEAELRELVGANSVAEFFSDFSKQFFGWTRRWINRPDGTTTMTLHDAAGNWTFIAHGTWEINKSGAYCLDVKWPQHRENWCRAVYRMQNGLYLDHPSRRDAKDRLGRITLVPASRSALFLQDEWVGGWEAILRGDGTYQPHEVSIDLTPHGGRWKLYSPQLVEKFFPCLTRLTPLSTIENQGLTIAFTLRVSEIVSGCEDYAFTLTKIGDELQGMTSTGWPIRLKRR
ncbi:hypothetical protein [Pseudorhodoferax sp.]|uniref:hypothetical protein n=1 Tax=Pseudorhodoferax sp. TaxID=1993553 RepID=UPI002DD6B5A9|nr:hypothetical protein [Pseudorhodoferax sp.]